MLVLTPQDSKMCMVPSVPKTTYPKIRLFRNKRLSLIVPQTMNQYASTVITKAVPTL